jgi:hypothetical protein
MEDIRLLLRFALSPRAKACTDQAGKLRASEKSAEALESGDATRSALGIFRSLLWNYFPSATKKCVSPQCRRFSFAYRCISMTPARNRLKHRREMFRESAARDTAPRLMRRNTLLQ